MKTRPYPTPPTPAHALAPPPPPNPDNTRTQEIPRIDHGPPDTRRWPAVAVSWTLNLIGAVLTGADNTTPLLHGIGIITLAVGAGTTGYHLHKWKDTT